MPDAANELSVIIRRLIEAAGPISFARFMELALYDAVHGYYRQPVKQIGCQGDFYTSVSVGPLFGHLLAFQFAQWLETVQKEDRTPDSPLGTEPLTLVEAGAHDGRLAIDILSWLAQKRPDLLDRLEYWIIEPSIRLRSAQAQSLAPFLKRVRWFAGWSDVPPRSVSGVIFANELLDGLPMVRLGWDQGRKKWFEWKVGLGGSGFEWVRAPRLDSKLEAHPTMKFYNRLPPDLAKLLPDGFTLEICPKAHSWWIGAAQALRNGKLLTFDYGLEWDEFLAPERREGTLRGYRDHRLVASPLSDPGRQDLTAHVNFSVLREAGENAGLKTIQFSAQSAFLTGIAVEALKDASQFGAWGSPQARQFITLTHPNYLGHAFRVLVQNTTDASLSLKDELDVGSHGGIDAP